MKETKRALQKKATREKILDTAANQFARYGFSVSTTDIAKQAGLSHGSIFVHFPTKEQLLDLVVEKFFEKLNIQIHTDVENQKTMSDVLNRHLDAIQTNECFYRNLVADITSLPTATQDKLFGYQTTLSFHFSAVLKKGQEEGQIKDIPRHMLFNMWIALINYYLVNGRMFQPEGSVIERYRQELTDSYLKLIRKD